MSDDLVKRLRLKRERCHDLSGVYYTEDADCQAAANRISALEDQLRGAIDECVRVGRLWHDAEAKLAKKDGCLEETYRRWKNGVDLRTLAKAEGCTQERMRHKMKRYEEDKVRLLEDKLEKLVIGAETVLEEWDRGDEAAFREAIDEMRNDVEEAKGNKT